MKRHRRTRMALICATGLLLYGCATAGLEARHETARAIAATNSMTRTDIIAPPFTLASWQRIEKPDAPLHVYIEGDGFAWVSRSTPSNNPTPKNPVALELAARDRSHNVVYLARPCQFTDFSAETNRCDRTYWMGKRFAAEVIASYNSALDKIRTQHPASGGIHLFGYSGGANIAGLLAAQRDDIASLRTIAGNVDNDYFTSHHSVSSMPQSMNMADYAGKLAHIPQYHFIAADDSFVPPVIYDSYRRKLPDTACVKSQIVSGTTHLDGWAARWGALLQDELPCL